MKLDSIYDKVKNPLDDEIVIKTLINMYETSLESDEFYEILVGKTEDNNFENSDIDEFYCMMFNEWKKSISEMSFKQFANLVKSESYKKNFSKMREFIEKLPVVKSKEQIDNIIFGNYKGKDSEIDEILKEYYWIKNDSSEWEYVFYNYIKLKRNSNLNIENLFIIDAKRSCIYKFVKLLVEKCNDYDLPYYFKFNKMGEKIDTIVIGSDSENLVNYIKIFDEIKRKNPEILTGLNRTPILTGRLSSWLGYGANLSKQSDLNFYDTRADAIKDAIENVIMSYIQKNKDNIELHEKILKNIIENLEARGEKNKLENFGIEEIKDVFLETIPDFINEFIENNTSSFDIDNIETGESILVKKDVLENTIKKSVLEKLQEDENYVEIVTKEIKKLSGKYNIDENKFCFDKNMIQKH